MILDWFTAGDWRCTLGHILLTPWILVLAAACVAAALYGLYRFACWCREVAENPIEELKDTFFSRPSVEVYVRLLIFFACMSSLLVGSYLSNTCKAPKTTGNAGVHKIIIRKGGPLATCEEQPGDLVLLPGEAKPVSLANEEASIIACPVEPEQE